MNTSAASKTMPSNDNDWERLVQADRVHRNVYIEPAIFSLEMDRVFAGSWVYLLHESEIPTTNDFRQVWLGTRELVAARGEVREANAGGGIRRLRQSMEGCHHECK